MRENPGPGPAEPWAFLRGLQQISFCDWPGRVSCVLFLGGCNLACPTCHNWQLAQDFGQLPIIPKDSLFAHLQSRQDWLDGVVISGGEPTCCPGLDCMLQELAAVGLPIKLDTNGLDPATIKDLLIRDLVQLIAVDVKGPWPKYPLLSGGKCSAEQAESALEQIFALSKEYPQRFYFRCTKVPALNSEDIEETRSYLPQGFELHPQDYVPPAQNEAAAKQPIYQQDCTTK
ncbi:MAG: anaerobic ribonucleoside-triphosphate reductase activating protein [Desulfohalobiaceae bacterium]